jgi:polyphosphate kinase
MQRNLSRRVEVAFSVYDERLRDELRQIMDLQCADTRKARVLAAGVSNKPATGRPDDRVRAQMATREF